MSAAPASTVADGRTDRSVDAYLDRLFDLLGGGGAAGRRALTEVADHLADGVAEGMASGLSRAEAERRAVDRLGSVDRLASQLSRGQGRAGVAVVLRQICGAGWLLGAAAAVSIGVAGALSWPIGRLFGADLIAADAPNEVLPAARCRYLLEYYPHAVGCQAASVAHHAEEVVRNGVAMGVLGAFALVAFAVARRGGRLARFAVTPPIGVLAAVGATMFGAAAAVLIESGASRLHSGIRSGAGFSVVGGIASLPALVVFAVLLLADLRRRAPAP